MLQPPSHLPNVHSVSNGMVLEILDIYIYALLDAHCTASRALRDLQYQLIFTGFAS